MMINLYLTTFRSPSRSPLLVKPPTFSGWFERGRVLPRRWNRHCLGCFPISSHRRPTESFTLSISRRQKAASQSQAGVWKWKWVSQQVFNWNRKTVIRFHLNYETITIWSHFNYDLITFQLQFDHVSSMIWSRFKYDLIEF